MNIFSPLASQIFGGALLALTAYHIYDEVRDARALNAVEKKLNDKTADYNTAIANIGTYTVALQQCNAGVESAAEAAEAVARAGAAAVSAVRRAGENNARTVANINAAPAATCEDAEAILRGEAG